MNKSDENDESCCPCGNPLDMPGQGFCKYCVEDIEEEIGDSK